MSQPAPAAMSVEEYYAWGEHQEDRYEYVDGFPRMMAGASRRHDHIVINVLGELRDELRGSGCEPFTAGVAVVTGPLRLRRPDVGVECGGRRDREYVVNEPRVVVEVLSPATRTVDLFGKLDEYRGVPSLREIVLIDPDTPTVRVWSRAEGGTWSEETVDDLAGAVDLPSLAISVLMAQVYDGFDFRHQPHLVPG